MSYLRDTGITIPSELYSSLQDLRDYCLNQAPIELGRLSEQIREKATTGQAAGVAIDLQQWSLRLRNMAEEAK